MSLGKHKAIMVLTVSMLMAVVLTASSDAKVVELKFSHQNPPAASTTRLFLDPYMAEIEKVTGNRVKVISYPAQSLVPVSQNFSAIEGGIADLGWVQLSYHAGRFPLTEVISLPFIGLPTAADNSLVLQQLYEQTPAMQKHFANVKVLFLHGSEPYMLVTKSPVQTLEDLKGMKIRTIGTMPAKMWSALGATPVFAAMPAVYELAQKGVIDGAHLAWATTSVTRAGEVLPYWTDIGTTVNVFGVLMNLDVWNELPVDIQEKIMSISGQTGAYNAGLRAWGPQIQGLVESTLAAGKFKFERVELKAGELEKIQALVKQPLWDEWIAEMAKRKLPGKEVLEKTLELMEARKLAAENF